MIIKIDILKEKMIMHNEDECPYKTLVSEIEEWIKKDEDTMFSYDMNELKQILQKYKESK